MQQAPSRRKKEANLTGKEQLGELLFFETSLSTPEGQYCSTCHKPERAFADPETGTFEEDVELQEQTFDVQLSFPLAFAEGKTLSIFEIS